MLDHHDQFGNGLAIEDAVANANPEEEEVREEEIHEEDDHGEHDEGDESSIECIKIAQQFIQHLKDATLDNSDMNPDDVDTLRNPPNYALDLTEPGLLLSIKIFMALTNALEDAYRSTRDAILEEHPDDNVYTYEQIQRKVPKLSGVIPIINDMCINSCLAYTGPFKDLHSCPICNET